MWQGEEQEFESKGQISRVLGMKPIDELKILVRKLEMI